MLTACAFLEFALCKQLEHKHNLLAFIFRLEVYPVFLFFLATDGVFHPVSDTAVPICMTCSLTWEGCDAAGSFTSHIMLHSCAPFENAVVEVLCREITSI